MIENTEFDILEKFQFEIKPIGVKFLVKIPDTVERLSEDMTMCEMIRWAQKGNSFYADVKNHTCDAGLYVLGQEDIAEPYLNGEYGTGLGVFDSPRSASRLYLHVSKIDKGVVNYIAFSPTNKLKFDPDVLVITATTSQAEIVLRATSYRTGDMWLSKYTAALGCSWILIYPYLSGEINHITTGLGFGMRRRHLFQEGLHLISVPYDKIGPLLKTLREMPWVPEPYKPDGLEYVRKLRIGLGLDPPE